MSKLKQLLTNEKVNLSEKDIEKLSDLLSGKKRFSFKSWSLMKDFLAKRDASLSTRKIQDICATFFGYRNRNTLVSLENHKDFPIKQWMDYFNIEDDFLKFSYMAWWNYQAEPRHKRNLYKVIPEQVKVYLSSVEKAFFEMEHSYVKDNFSSFHFKGIPSSLPNYLISPNMISNNYLPSFYQNILCTKENDVEIDYSIFDLDFTKLDFKRIGEYYISLPKNIQHVKIGVHLAKNCMEGQALNCYKRIKANPEQFNQGNMSGAYLDAHIIEDKTNRIVGVLALEEIVNLKKHGKVSTSLFVNVCNGKNNRMESLLLKLIKDVYSIEPEKEYTLCEQEVAPFPWKDSHYEVKSDLPRKVVDNWMYHFKSKK